MVLKGLTPIELMECLDSCQTFYNKNLEFHSIKSKYIGRINTKGIKAVNMADEVIIADDNGKQIIIYISNKRRKEYVNPFNITQKYYIHTFMSYKQSNRVKCYHVDIIDGISVYPHNEIADIKRVVGYLKQAPMNVQINFRLKVKDSTKAGHRLGYPDYFGNRKQRRLSSACWHVHRDVMIEIFNKNPNAKLKTSVAYYSSKEDFYCRYEETGYKNVGSILMPCYLSDLCEC